MTNEQIKVELARWIDAGQPKVWTRLNGIKVKDWELCDNVFWNSYKDMNYIVDDKHAELRKLQIDEPNTQFQVLSKTSEQWVDISVIFWDLCSEYRVKPKEWYKDPNMVGKPCWFGNKKEQWFIGIFYHFSNDSFYNSEDGRCFKYAKPVECDDLYKEK